MGNGVRRHVHVRVWITFFNLVFGIEIVSLSWTLEMLLRVNYVTTIALKEKNPSYSTPTQRLFIYLC